MKQTAKQAKKYVGTHIIADFFGGKCTENPVLFKKLLYCAARKSNNKPLKFVFHAFSPQGITGIALLAESHIAVHTWPELSYIAVDIFTCGRKTKPENALKFLQEAMHPTKVRVKRVQRGMRKSAQ